MVDEPALSDMEIQALYIADTTGKVTSRQIARLVLYSLEAIELLRFIGLEEDETGLRSVRAYFITMAGREKLLEVQSW